MGEKNFRLDPQRNQDRKLFAMKSSMNFGLAFLAALMVIPNSGWASSTIKNCPIEPASNTPISSGVTYYGANCVIATTGDVDSFQFNATAGTTWRLAAGLGPPPEGANVCLTLYPPGSSNAIFHGCGNGFGVSTTQKLPDTGLYRFDITESTNAVISYGVSLERLAPPPPDALALVLGQNNTGVIPPTAQETFTFCGSTSGTYQIAASPVPGTSFNVCFAVYQNGTAVVSGMCSNGGPVIANVTPTQAGTYVVDAYAAIDYGTVDYNLEVSCLTGNCKCSSEKCLLEDALSYAAGTLTMDFTIGSPYAATWNAWLVSGNTTQLLWSQSQQIAEPPISVIRTQSVATSGTVGILSTLTTPTRGLACSSWELINTGKP